MKSKREKPKLSRMSTMGKNEGKELMQMAAKVKGSASLAPSDAKGLMAAAARAAPAYVPLCVAFVSLPLLIMYLRVL